MATATEVRFTPEDLLKITDRPMPELVDGELLEREMGQEADRIALLLGGILLAFVRPRGLGIVNGSQCGYQIFPDAPGKVRIPDVSFTRAERVPPGGPAKGHSRVAPDLAVEVVSPKDLASEVFVKVREYFSAGVPMVLILDPEARMIVLCRPDGSARTFRDGDVLDLGEIVPGFAHPVADFFA